VAYSALAIFEKAALEGAGHHAQGSRLVAWGMPTAINLASLNLAVGGLVDSG